MRTKTLFSITDGEKVTEKALRRVLISSICSILLCMTCLVSTTWAWFAVSIENTGNVIQIGKPEIKLTVADMEYNSGTELSDTDIALNVVHTNNADDFDKKSVLYVTLTIQNDGGTSTVYTTLNESNNYSAAINIKNSTGKPCSFSWTASWFTPVNAVALTHNTIILNAVELAEPSTQPTTETITDSAAEPSAEPTTGITEPAGTVSPEETTDTTEGER